MSDKACQTLKEPKFGRLRAGASIGAMKQALGWALGTVTIVSFVAIPLVFSGDFTLWQEIPTTNPFGATPTLVVAGSTGSTVTLSFQTDVGRQDPTNVYSRQICDSVVLEIGSDGVAKGILPTSKNCFDGGDFPFITDGACCASENGYFEAGLIRWTATNANGDLVEFRTIPGTPVPMPTAPAIAVELISATLHRTAFGWVATGYNVTTSMVEIYVGDGSQGGWTFLTSVPCDSPFDNYHWDVEASSDSDKLFLSCRNGGPVQVAQIDLATGSVEWSEQIDSTPAATEFFYQQCDACGTVTFGGGAPGEALACMSPGPGGTKICMLGPVGNPTAPSNVQCVTYPDAAPDRQMFNCDGSMIYYHGADPDGTGALNRIVNCGKLDGPCISKEHEDNTRNVTWAGAFLDQVQVHPTGTPTTPIQYDRLPIVEGENTPGEGVDVVRYGTISVPLFFDNFESGDLRMWSNTVGVPAGPGADSPEIVDPGNR